MISRLPVAVINTAALERNFSRLSSLRAGKGPSAPVGENAWPALMPVVKSDAYGHGQEQAARVFCRAGASLVASGSVAECLDLRESLAAAGFSPRIVALLGVMTAEEAELAAKARIIPVLHDIRQLSLLPESEPLEIAVKCNSGMSRLGLNQEDISAFCEVLQSRRNIVPVLALSHLASADEPDGRHSVLRQAEHFAESLRILRSRFPNIAPSLANSAGLLRGELMDGIIGPQVCRPGIALYGCNPLEGTSDAERGAFLEPAMHVETALSACRTLPKGFGFGYGFTFNAPEDMPVGIAVAGYADFFSRSFSGGRGEMRVNGAPAPVIGRVSMQMTALDLRACPNAKPGDAVRLLDPLGPNPLRAEDLARAAGTISYEVLCLLGSNARRYTAG